MKKRVLFVGDEEIFRIALRIALKRKKIDLVAEADRSLKNLIPAFDVNDFYNLLIIDISMPEMSGIDVLEYLTQEKKDIPVIAITDHMHHDLRFFCSGIRSIRIIQKPFDQNELIGEVLKLLD
ncbi:response regulator [Seleniivibrio woodruffii]|uniref:response regulator n=1 Tax=Seleniivibrio woodruffii TaxID=1078050 RepID=UPI002409A649|nr:response regulator [Seleniivibrio woodruffii]